MNDQSIQAQMAALRDRAEAKLLEHSDIDSSVSRHDALTLLHELQVHQVELEMQNEELRRTQREAEIERERYIDLFNQAPVGYLTLGIDGLIVEANDKVAALLGVERHALSNLRLQGFIVEQDRPQFMSLYRDALMKKVNGAQEVRVQRPDGTQAWLRLHMVLSPSDCTGDWICRVTLTDVTERVITEQQRAALAAIVATSEDAIMSRDSDGFITSWNAAAERMTGYAAEEMLGRRLEALLPGSETGLLQSLSDRKDIGHAHVNFKTKPGTTVPVSVMVSPLYDNKQRWTGNSVIARDISEQIKAEKALHQRLEQLEVLAQIGKRLSAASEITPEMLCDEVTQMGRLIGADLHLVYLLNCATQQLELVQNACGSLDPNLKLALDAVIKYSAPLATVFTRGQDEVIVQALDVQDVAELAELYQAGVRCYSAFAICTGGQCIGAAVFAKLAAPQFRPSDLQVMPIMCNLIATNLERSRLFSEVQSNQEALIRADQRKDRFIATLAHELRNPMAPIKNALTILRWENIPPARATAALDMMSRQVDYLVRLIDDLLDISRISRGKVTLQRKSVRLTDVLRDATELSSPLIEARRINLEIRLPVVPVFIHGDPIRLAQVFANLLNNAAKYTECSGDIEVTGQLKEHVIAICVRDSGIGIAPEFMPYIFDMFTQGDLTSGGLGIGLTLVQSLVEMHGGSIRAESEGVGLGSRFYVDLPVHAEADVGLHEPKSKCAPLSSTLRVLLVDDNQDAADSLAELLRLEGSVVTVCYDGRSALRALDESNPTVVIMDIGMPEMDGNEIAARIRSDPQHRHLSLIALTGWGRPEDIARTKSAGFNYHLVKPADLRSLRDLLVKLNQA